MTSSPLPPKPQPVRSALNRPYWDGTASGVLRIQHCRACDARFLYARTLCPACWKSDLLWEAATGRGHILAITTVHQAPYAAFADDAPYRIAIIRLEEGAQLMANIIGAGAMDAVIGDPVEVTFEQRGDVVIPQFQLRH